MEFSWLSALFGAFGLGVVKLFWEITKYFIKRKDSKIDVESKFNKQKIKIEELFNDLLIGSVEIQEYIEEFVIEHSADRITVLRLENGGGVPQLGTTQHISIIYEAINKNNSIDPIKSDFQNYTIDAAYQKLMMQVITIDHVVVITDDMDDGILQKVYKAHGINKSIISSISHIPSLDDVKSKGFLIYMSIQFKDDREIGPKIESDFAILRDKIAQIFHTFYIKRVTLFE